jgi:prepilin-type N-terminal cleavage/methylation domain-containing protein
MTNKTSGFTMIEVMVAIVILSIGLLALGGATANVSKMAGYGKWATAASQVATRRLETIRQVANSTTPACTSLASGGPVVTSGVTEQWRVSGSGGTRAVVLVVTYPRAQTTVSDTIVTLVRC